MRASPLSFSLQHLGGYQMLGEIQETTPVKQDCTGCKYHGKMKIKRGRKRVIIYCPGCGKVLHRRNVY